MCGMVSPSNAALPQSEPGCRHLPFFPSFCSSYQNRLSFAASEPRSDEKCGHAGEMAVFKKLKKGKDKGVPLPEPEPVKQLDKRVGMDTYRDFFTLKNYWKAIDRKRQDSAQLFFSRYLNQNPENTKLYPKLKNIDGATVDMTCSDPGFEAVAASYLKVFDDVISAVEEKPADVQPACDKLTAVGKMHKAKASQIEHKCFQAMEEPFLHMVKEVLQDRFNEKAEGLFRKFFSFCLKYLLEDSRQCACLSPILTNGFFEQLSEDAGPLLQTRCAAYAPQALSAQKLSTDCAQRLY
ncbi:hypothetical protein Y032_0129g1494 [Ancylostoma ceylanicum]|uniref:Globin domain-containing protein n=1 Tax=Ancylostoma ceylanicum TaxID=53326 RepID=A0A016T6V0_9BILA|nr:hypothetical protein Y032_0129g1494 [Ancylostoma ceylanicum]